MSGFMVIGTVRGPIVADRVASIDRKANIVNITPPGHWFGYKEDQRFFFLNVLEEVDSPDEYYIDRSNGILYFWPGAVITDSSATISTADQIVTLTSVSNVAFVGITLESAKVLVSITGGASNIISGCVLRGSSRDAVDISGSPGSGVAHCDISEVGEMGVWMYGRETALP